MPKAIKTVAIIIAALIVLLLAAAGIVAATFDPNHYKPQIIRLVKEKTGRTLTIPGDIHLSFFPKIGIDLGQASISEPGGNTEFASVERARISLALIPLLSRQLVVDQVRVDGLRAAIRRFKDGSTNIDDLLASGNHPAAPGAPPAAPAPPASFDIDGIRIGNATIVFDDQQHARRFELAGLNLDTGRIANDVPSTLRLNAVITGSQPQIDARVALKTGFTMNTARRHYLLKGLDAELSGSLAGLTGVKLKAGGDADLDLEQHAAAATLKGNLDESAFDARLGLTGFSPAAYTFDIGIDRIDLDRYKSKPVAAVSNAPKAPVAPPAAAPAKSVDLSALRDLRADGRIRIGALQAAHISASDVRVDLHAAGGKLVVDPLAASLYGGSAAGRLTLDATQPARLALRQNLSGIQAGPLLKDATGSERIEGKGNVQLDVSARGTTFDQIKKTLDGGVRIALRDGALRGINIAQAVRNAKAKIDAVRGEAPAQAGTGSSAEKTDFSELDASFRIANGVAHNDDLDLKSPLIRAGGSGDINLGAGRLDYLVKATIVPTLQGQGGPELQALKGLTIPVRLSGPFDAIAWRIDFAGMAGDLAKQKLDERKGELKAKAQQQLEEQKARAQEQLRGRLKGLFGK